MAVIIFCAKFLGLLREIMIAGVYGQGYASDVLNTSTQIPLLFFDMTLGVAILSTFVPVFNMYLERDGRDRAIEFSNNFMTLVVTAAAFFSVVGMIFAVPIVKLMVPGWEADKVAETAALLRILFPSIIFTAAAYTSVGILQSFGEFNIPSVISVVSNLIMIAYLLIAGNKFGLEGVIVSMAVAWAAQLLIQLPPLKRYGYRYKPVLNLRDEGIAEAARLAVPVLISSWVQPLCTVINMAFGSGMGDGAVAGLNWANKIYIIMVGVFAYAVTNFIFPKLSRMSVGDNDEAFAETTRTSLGWIILIIAYVSAMFIALNRPIIKIVFERGAFTAENTDLTANALFYYSFGMVGYAVCEVLNKSFYAVHDGKTPMLASAAGVAFNFVSAFVFVKVLKMGLGGLALASASSSVFIALILLSVINRRKKGVVNRGFVINTVKTLAAAAVSCITARLMYVAAESFASGGFAVTLIKLVIAALPALIIYILLGFVLKTDETRQIRRLGNGK